MRVHATDKDAHHYIPYLDGKRLKNCFFADEEAGEVHVYVWPNLTDFIDKYPKAELFFKKNYFTIAVLKGNVKIVDDRS